VFIAHALITNFENDSSSNELVSNENIYGYREECPLFHYLLLNVHQCNSSNNSSNVSSHDTMVQCYKQQLLLEQIINHSNIKNNSNNEPSIIDCIAIITTTSTAVTTATKPTTTTTYSTSLGNTILHCLCQYLMRKITFNYNNTNNGNQQASTVLQTLITSNRLAIINTLLRSKLGTTEMLLKQSNIVNKMGATPLFYLDYYYNYSKSSSNLNKNILNIFMNKTSKKTKQQQQQQYSTNSNSYCYTINTQQLDNFNILCTYYSYYDDCDEFDDDYCNSLSLQSSASSPSVSQLLTQVHDISKEQLQMYSILTSKYCRLTLPIYDREKYSKFLPMDSVQRKKADSKSNISNQQVQTLQVLLNMDIINTYLINNNYLSFNAMKQLTRVCKLYYYELEYMLVTVPNQQGIKVRDLTLQQYITSMYHNKINKNNSKNNKKNIENSDSLVLPMIDTKTLEFTMLLEYCYNNSCKPLNDYKCVDDNGNYIKYPLYTASIKYLIRDYTFGELHAQNYDKFKEQVAMKLKLARLNIDEEEESRRRETESILVSQVINRYTEQIFNKLQPNCTGFYVNELLYMIQKKFINVIESSRDARPMAAATTTSDAIESNQQQTAVPVVFLESEESLFEQFKKNQLLFSLLSQLIDTIVKIQKSKINPSYIPSNYAYMHTSYSNTRAVNTLCIYMGKPLDILLVMKVSVLDNSIGKANNSGNNDLNKIFQSGTTLNI